MLEILKKINWNKIIEWGIAFPIMLLGVMVLVVNGAGLVSVPWPDWVIAGSIPTGTGLIMWIISYVLDHQQKMTKLKLEAQNKKETIEGVN